MSQARRRFQELHRSGCFVLPNPWDVGGARRLEARGFKALASSSAAAAWSLGRADQQISLDEALAHLRMLCGATGLPVNADFEAGFADGPDGVGRNVGLAIETGVAGLSIEDRTGAALYDQALAVERIAAARAAIEASGEAVVLVARSEGFLIGQTDLAATIVRLQAYAEAGADCLYAPGVRELSAIREIVSAVAPKPVNVLLGTTDGSVAEIAETGARRVSVGGHLAALAWRAFDQATDMLLETGRLPPRG